MHQLDYSITITFLPSSSAREGRIASAAGPAAPTDGCGKLWLGSSGCGFLPTRGTGELKGHAQHQQPCLVSRTLGCCPTRATWFIRDTLIFVRAPSDASRFVLAVISNNNRELSHHPSDNDVGWNSTQHPTWPQGVSEEFNHAVNKW